jgi:exonuclease III
VFLICWNLAGRVRRLSEQVELVLGHAADVICLQELTPATLPRWRERLQEAGYRGVATPNPPSGAPRRRPLAVLSACREPVRAVAVADVPWPERVLALRTRDGVEVLNVHSPISPSPRLAKVHTHLAVYRHLARAARHPRLLCGDLNTPRREHADGRIWTFARDRYGRLREDRGEAWEAAELSLLRGLEPYGFRDAYRELHGYRAREISWGWARWRGGYRLDHLLVAGLTVQECRYEHAWREAGLSDHSALLARLSPSRKARPGR